jgi:pyridoxine 5-phosphate synthase
LGVFRFVAHARDTIGYRCASRTASIQTQVRQLVQPIWGVALKMTTTLSVNVNKVALVRNTRYLGIPSVVRAAEICLRAGAHGITVHPRPDGRHIRAGDVADVAALLADWPGREFNIEGNPTQNLLDAVRHARPAQCTLVPDSVEQFTSDHGWDLADAATRAALRPLIAEAKALGARVSLFLDAEPALMAAARELGADRVELYTEPYAAAWASGDAAARAQSLARYAQAARAALDAGLAVNAGHDLNRDNLTPFLRAVPGVAEVSIGHALIADALELGYAATVQAYLACIADAQNPI